MKRILSAVIILFLSFFLNLSGFAGELPAVDFFSPQGTVKGIRQVSVRFSGQMVPFGDPRSLTDPFDIACPAPGAGRWADGKNWIYDFNADLPAGISCTFSLKPGLKNLAGIELSGQKIFTFSTGGPAIIRTNPYHGNTIDEEQIFILTLDAEPDTRSVLEHASFSVEGIAGAIGIRLIEGKDREKILAATFYKRAQRGKIAGAEPPVVLIQSKQRFPNHTAVRLIWGKGVKSKTGVATSQDQIFTYETRKEFMAEFSCDRENPQAGCIPFLPMTLNFTAPLSKEQAGKIILRASDPKTLPAPTGKKLAAASNKAVWKAQFDQNQAYIYSVTFAGPFPENAKFTLELPPGLKDDASRKLVNANQFPLAVRTGDYPPLAKFSGRFGILESKTGALLPVTVRNLEASLKLSTLNAAGDVSGKIMNIKTDRGKDLQAWLRKVATVSRTQSIFTGSPAVKSFSLPKPGGAKAFEVIGVPLGGPGFYVVELESHVLGKALLDKDLPMRVQTTALVTNLAAHFKQGRESSLVWVTTLDSAQPVKGADVTIRDCQDKIIWQGKTDSAGIASIKRKLTDENKLPYCSFKEDENHDWRYDESYQLSGLQGGLFITAQSGADLTFVHSSWDQGIEPWRFQLLEEFHPAPTIAHTVFDRTLLRAGDTVHMKHILREHTSSGFRFSPKTSWPAKATITHSGSGQKYEFPLKWDAKGVAETTWAIPKEAKLGRYDIHLQSFSSGNFRVEEYRIPLMRGAIKPPVKPLIKAREAALDVSVQYLAGSGAGNLPVKMRAEVRPKHLSSFESYDDFTFANGGITSGVKRRGDYSSDDSEESDSGKTVKLPLRNIVLDAAGSLRVNIDRLPQADLPRELAAEMEFADPNGEISTVSSRVPLWPSQYLIGIKPDSWASSREKLKFQVAVLDISGAPVTGAKVKVDILERKNYSHRKRLIGGFYAYEHITEIKKIGLICEGKTGARGLLVCEAKSPVSGNVILQAESADQTGRKTVANRDIWVADKEDWWFDASDHDRIDLIAEKKRYEPGEKAVFQVRMPFREATALISIEREGILDAWIKPVSGNNPIIEVPVKASYAPNVFVSALVVRGRVAGIQPGSKVDLGKPAYKLGIAEINVGWKNHELKLSVTTDTKVYKVRDKVKVKIKALTAQGQAPPAGSEVAVAAVDEGLLELMPNRSWELLQAMMGRRGTSVKTATAQMQVVGKRHFGLKALAQGGGGGLASGHEPTREMFDPLLSWKGRVTLDARGEASIDVPLNDSLTSFRIVAVATAGAGYFGTGHTSIRSTQDLMVLSGLSPVVREGDKYFAGFTIRNTSEQPMDVTLSASVAEMKWQIMPLGATLAAGESKEIGWNTTAPFGIEKMTWTIDAKDAKSGTTDRIRVTQNIVPATPVRTYQATITQLDKPYQLEVERPASAIPGLGGVKTTLKPKISDGLDGVTDYMKKYSYSCMEQKVSVAVALRDEALWKETMGKLPAYLDNTGLIKFFPLSFLCGSPTLTSYILAIADEAGWPIPENAKQKMQNGLTHFIAGKATCSSWFPAADLSIRKLSAIEALSRDGKASVAMLDSISIEPNLWPTSAVIDWRNILRNIPDIRDNAARVKEAEQILRSRLNFQGTTMGFSTERSDVLWWLMVSVDVNAVRALITLMNEPSWKEDMPRLAQGALARQKKGHWDLTLANAWGVLAMEKFSKTFESVPVAGQTATTLGQQSRTLNWKTNPKGGSERLAWPQRKSPISISHAGAGKPWLTVTSTAAIPLVKPFSSGYKITKTISPVSQKRPNHWTKGDVLRVRLDLEAQADQTWVVVNDPVPAGTTILGGGLGRDSQILTAGEKNEGRVWPAFEERTFEAFRAYYEYVPKGKWRVEYTVRLNASGTFQLPATRVEAMYFPEMLGEWPNAAVTVER
ncbi:MAG: alpha-2-macroglobulin [Deltaproteobacteria bacterium HGW-Deltaproteobacteria-6]|nr:MAG: alpha-2-macroglobulin [Deltaproteobacteria bacterium HGW-Deltaproteobacteria-6]